MQNQAMAGPAEQSTAQENLSAQRGRLAIGAEATGALEFSEQIEQQQDAAVVDTGHQLLGLARSDAAGKSLAAAGAQCSEARTTSGVTIQSRSASRDCRRRTRCLSFRGSASAELFCTYSSGNAVVYLIVSIAKLELTSESSAVLISRL
jgi:hypothetical protein